MKWLTFEADGDVMHGYIDGDDIVVTGTGDLMAVVSGDEARPDAPTAESSRRPLADVKVLTPLQRPGKVLAVAANFQSHVRESGGEDRDRSIATPRLFSKPDTSVVGPDAEVELNPITTKLDWEAELAVVIGRTARNVDENEALDHVFGYATSNDISARSLELGDQRDDDPWTGFFDWLEGKWLDGSAPIGPYLVTADEVPDPQNLRITLTLNGETRQDGTTADMVHSVAKLIAFSSRLMTLNPGDVILTGTPAGVGGVVGEYLKPGDVMVTEVEGLGALTTRIVAPTGRHTQQ